MTSALARLQSLRGAWIIVRLSHRNKQENPKIQKSKATTTTANENYTSGYSKGVKARAGEHFLWCTASEEMAGEDPGTESGFRKRIPETRPVFADRINSRWLRCRHHI